MKDKRMVKIYDNDGLPIAIGRKTGRNEKCGCMSNKKYKDCCWITNDSKIYFFPKIKNNET